MSSSLVLLLVVCVLVLSPCVSGSASYTLYSDNACATQIATGSGIATQSTGSGSTQVVTTQCFAISGATNQLGGIINGGSSGGQSASTFATYTTSSCGAGSNAYTTSSSSSGSNGCVVALSGTGSAKWSVSGASHSAMLSLPILLLLLAGLLVVLV